MGAVALRDAEARTGALFLIDERARKMKRVPYPEDAGLIGWSIRNNEVLVSSDAENDPRRDAALDERVGAATAKTAMAVPLEGENEAPMGAIAIYNKRGGRPFTDEDRELFELITANASTAIRLQLARETREREERLTTIGRLLSGVIHDLKTPLTVISGYVQLMQGSSDRAQREHYAELVLRQFDLIGAMQREVLEFARGEKSVLVRKVYLQNFFEDVRVQLEADLARRGIELVVDVQERGTARFDEGKILRVVHNLARNAAEAMGPGGGKFVIKVTRDKEDSALVVSFSDTGPGIPKEIEHRLFQSFVTSGKKGGTGLGLAIVKKIAEEHGGSIAVQSSSRGATFKLRHPAGVSDAMKRSALPLAAGLAVALVEGAPASRGDVPCLPWIDEGDVPLASWSRSVVPRPDQRGHPGDLLLFSGPNRGSPKRGVTASGATFPLFAAKRGGGCNGRWLLVGPLAWTCSDDATVGPEEPQAPPRAPRPDGLLREYFFVPPQGASAYADVQMAEEGAPDRELEGGWGVAVVGQRTVGGQRWEQTSKGLWIAARDLGAARPSLFHGEKLDGGPLDLAWVVADKASVWPEPRPRRRRRRRRRASRSSTSPGRAASTPASATVSGCSRAISVGRTWRPRPPRSPGRGSAGSTSSSRRRRSWPTKAPAPSTPPWSPPAAAPPAPRRRPRRARTASG